MDPIARADLGVDRALRLIIPADLAEAAGAILMELLGPFEEQTQDDDTVLVFYLPAGEAPTTEDVSAALPAEMRASGLVRLETSDVPRDWVDGWKEHFRPIAIDGVRIRPPWEPALDAADHAGAVEAGASPTAEPESGGAPAAVAAQVAGAPRAVAAQVAGAPRAVAAPLVDGAPRAVAAPLVDVVINPGLGFGTGLHPTTRGTLRLLQRTSFAGSPSEASLGAPVQGPRGPLVDAGTGSGILAIAAAKLGWGPVYAFDNDPVALISARENVEANGVEAVVEMHEHCLDDAPLDWFAGATVLANMTLEPVLALLRRLAGASGPSDAARERIPGPVRVVVSGILAGTQEGELLGVAGECGLACGERVHESEWVSLELLPVTGRHRAGDESAGEGPGVDRHRAGDGPGEG